MKSRSLLAKLLATENISVQSSTTQPTASFNIDSRILTLPVLENHDDDIYDMFVGHEVAHALWTPSDGAEKAHENVDDANRMFYQQCLNIIEDIRIEKAIQQKYKGLTKTFSKAYKKLWEQGFFGVKDTNDLANLNFADRLNIHYKQRWNYGADDIPFSEQEQALVELADTPVTFDDTIDVATKLFDFMKEQMDSQAQEQPQGESQSQDQPNSNDGFEEFKKQFVKPEYRDDPASQDELREAYEKFTEVLGDDDDQDDTTNQEQGSQGVESSQLHSVTEKSLNNAFKESCNYEWDDRRSRENISVVNYGDIDIDLDKAIWKFDSLYADSMSSMNVDRAMSQAIEWQKSLKPEVNHLSKEFNLRKSAEAHKRATVNRTGVLDDKALHKYRYSDEIFLSQTIVPEGKNHGLVAFIDWSASMDGVMGETIDQLAIMANFCFNNAIPFQAFAYSTCGGGNGYEALKLNNTNYAHDFRLFELFTPLPKRSVFQKQMTMLFVAKQTVLEHYGPYHFQTGGTPLNVSMALAPKIIRKFAKATGVEKLTTVVLTDGEDGSSLRFDGSRESVSLRNPTTGRVIDTHDTKQIYKYIKDTTGSNVVVIHLSREPEFIQYNTVWNHDKADYEHIHSTLVLGKVKKLFKDQGYVQYDRPDFDAAIVVNIKHLKKNVATIDDLNDDVSTTKLRNTFRKARADKKKAKMVLTAFANQVA